MINKSLNDKEFYNIYGRRNDLTYKEFNYLRINRHKDCWDRFNELDFSGDGQPDSYGSLDPVER